MRSKMQKTFGLFERYDVQVGSDRFYAKTLVKRPLPIGGCVKAGAEEI
jgi:hypothetical protein